MQNKPSKQGFPAGSPRFRPVPWIQLAVAFAVGLAIALKSRYPLVGWTLAGAAAVAMVAVAVSSSLADRIVKANQTVTQTAGTILNCLLLGGFYLTCFTVGRLLLLIFRKDPMDRRFPSPGATFWRSCVPSTDDTRQY